MFPSLFNKFKAGFKKAFGGLSGLFAKKIDPETLDALEEALYGADFGVETANEILEEIKKAYAKNKELHGADAAAIGKEILQKILEGAEGKFDPVPATRPEVIELVGVNGAGKTTTAAKLAYRLEQDGHKTVLGACDTFRAAANEQIAAWAKKLDLQLVASQHGGDAAAVAFDTVSAAKARNADFAILDTAGRLHTKSHLMDEVKKIGKAVAKVTDTAPRHRWLVIDGTLGSNSIEQARVFNEQFELTGLIVTKLDGSSRGGALVGIWRELQIPVYFVGLGEKPEDLQPFSTQNYIDAIFN
ncbi:MAG: signal recognition particle-docking protein FtsY [Opitutales bacterium]|nr:signal recognition particle-docking protein FtsY [Opitutales bacterium]